MIQKNDLDGANNIRNYTGSYDRFCEGYGNDRVRGGSYVLGLVLATAVVKEQFSHAGSSTLDFINAFDKAEVAETNIGKINMINVSSFCGPQGLILGYDLLRSKEFEKYKMNFARHPSLKIYSIEPLIKSTQGLIGTLDNPVYPIIPGSHVPCAGRHIEAAGPCTLYAALAMGVSENGLFRHTLLMEDSGFISTVDKQQILENLIESVVEVGKNQKTEYKTIFVGLKTVAVDSGMVGCALVHAPYLLLPKQSAEILEQKPDLETWNIAIKSHES